jgi:uncharacterized protein (DUF433 family)
MAADETTAYSESVPTEIVPGITSDPEREFGKPVIAGTTVSAASVLALLAAGRSEVEIRTEYALTSEQIRAALRYAAWLAERPALDAAFAAIWSDPARNAEEAALDREADDQIDAGGGFRGSIDDLNASIDG